MPEQERPLVRVVVMGDDEAVVEAVTEAIRVDRRPGLYLQNIQKPSVAPAPYRASHVLEFGVDLRQVLSPSGWNNDAEE